MNKVIIFQAYRQYLNRDCLLKLSNYRFLCTQVLKNTENEINLNTQKLIKIAVVGVPNAGKSTFINNLIDHRVCATSNKVHTTRKTSKAICIKDNTQIILFDTPGLVTKREIKKHQLESSFTSSCRHSIQHSNLIAVIHDVSNSWTRNSLHPTVLNLLESYPNVPSFLVLNKIDLLKSKRVLLDLVKLLTNNSLQSKEKLWNKRTLKPFGGKDNSNQEKTAGWQNFSDVFFVSSLTGDGLQKVMELVISHGKEKKWEHSVDEFSDESNETIIVESVRARLLDYLPQEIPYLLKSSMDYYNNENGKIYASIQVECPSLRIEKLVCGESNGKLKQITERVTSDLVTTFGIPISLTISTILKKNI